MKLLWICSVWPEPDSSAAGTRTFRLLQGLRDRDISVSVTSGCKDSGYRAALETIGIATELFEPNDSRFDEYLKQTKPDVVIFDRFMTEEQFSFRVRQQLPEAVRVLDTVDLHGLRRVRQKLALQSPASQSSRDKVCLEVPDAALVGDDFLREIASILRSDLALMVSDAEIDFLVNRCGVPRRHLTRCSLLYPFPDFYLAPVSGEGASFNQRAHFIAIGNCNHPPNMDGFEVLTRAVWPQINKLLRARDVDGIELHLYGAYPNNALIAMKNPALGIIVQGKAPDAVTTLAQYRVNLAPLRFGAGVKGKIADGWFAGTPCVSTTLGAEGMNHESSFGGYVTDSWREFAEFAVELYLNENEWRKAQAVGFSLVQKLFSQDAQLISLTAALNVLSSNQSDTAAIRAKNVVGEILWREQYRSTEFFSRWIEEKNRGK